MAIDLTSYMLGKKSSGGGSTGALVPVVVEELPTTGEEGKLYLVPRQVSETNNVFDEYIWINNDFELIGTAEIDISGKQDKFQFSTMPNATSTNVGQIVQYIGQTTASYTNGYFYICVSDGQATPTYSWVNLNVQNNGVDDLVLYLESDADWNSVTSVIVDNAFKSHFNNLQIPINKISELGKKLILIKDTYNNYHLCFFEYIASNSLKITKPIYFGLAGNNTGTATVNIQYLTAFCKTTNGYYEIVNCNFYGRHADIPTQSNVLAKNNTTSFTPTSDYNPATKKYVDDNKFDVTSISGYDASATQVLKNVNGTLTWVEDIQQVINGEVSDSGETTDGGEVGGQENNEGGNKPDPNNNEEQNE